MTSEKWLSNGDKDLRVGLVYESSTRPHTSTSGASRIRIDPTPRTATGKCQSKTDLRSPDRSAGAGGTRPRARSRDRHELDRDATAMRDKARRRRDVDETRRDRVQVHRHSPLPHRWPLPGPIRSRSPIRHANRSHPSTIRRPARGYVRVQCSRQIVYEGGRHSHSATEDRKTAFSSTTDSRGARILKSAT